MVKCSECGYSNNPASSDACIKCNSKLNLLVPVNSAKPKPTVSNMKKTQAGKGGLKKTIEGQQLSTTPMACSECSYSIRAGQSICPNCGHDNVGNVGHDEPSISIRKSGPKTIRLNDFVTEEELEPIEEVIPSFSLAPVHGKEKEPIIKEGKEFILGRSDFDPEDMTISSKEHLKLEFEDGEWYLSNTSTNEALFIQVKGRLKITDGQVLLIGQKKYYRFDSAANIDSNNEEEE